MKHTISTTHTTRSLLSIAAAALLTAVSSMACSGSALESSPLAPSAVPSFTLSAESGDSSDAWATLGKDKDKGKGKDGTGSGTGDDTGTGDDSDSGKDKGKGKDKDGTATSTQTVVEAAGAIGATVTGACPAKTFTVGVHSITTNAQTTYKGGLCADLVALAEIEVRAAKQTDGTLLATRVEFEDADADEGDEDDADDDEDADDKGKGKGKGKDKDKDGDKDGDGDKDEDTDEEDDDAKEGGRNPHHGAGPHEGTVSSFRGTCPTVAFNLKGLRISTTDGTKYVGEGAKCELLRPNVKVLVTGKAGTEARTFVAETITIVRSH